LLTTNEPGTSVPVRLTAGEADPVFEGRAFRQGVRLVAERGQQVKEEGLGFALLVALELGGKLGELPQTFFQ
jgi:hypothetical protein